MNEMQLPHNFYWIAGALLITNLGAIGSFLMIGFKAVWWASKLESKVDAAHNRLDILEDKL